MPPKPDIVVPPAGVAAEVARLDEESPELLILRELVAEKERPRSFLFAVAVLRDRE